MESRTRTGIRLLLAVATVALCALVAMDDPAAIAAQSNFVGGEPSRPDSSDIRALRLRFEAGSRSNWHSHANWQILMAEEGRGRTQIRGEEIVELVPGRPVHTGPDVVHWHAAAPDEHVMQLTFVSGQTSWLDAVSDEDYLGRQLQHFGQNDGQPRPRAPDV